MALIKYYNLESQSWEDVSGLERNLQKHLLDEQRTRAILGTDVEDVSEAKMGNGDKDTLATLLYDSGDFDVLYRHSRTISKGKKRMFGKSTPPRIGTEMVVRARPEDILELQDYLGSSGFEVVEARGVSNANFVFTTKPQHKDAIQNYREMIKGYIDSRYEKLGADLKSEDDVVMDGKKGSTCTGIVWGPVVDTLELRRVILNGGYGIPISQERVTFIR
ncbi:hypothetical protein ACFL0E_00810 [Nanoarchaeota archaeon]